MPISECSTFSWKKPFHAAKCGLEQVMLARQSHPGTRLWTRPRCHFYQQTFLSKTISKSSPWIYPQARCQPGDFPIPLRVLLFDFVIFAPKNRPKVIEAARTFQTFHLHGVREQPGNQSKRVSSQDVDNMWGLLNATLVEGTIKASVDAWRSKNKIIK